VLRLIRETREELGKPTAIRGKLDDELKKTLVEEAAPAKGISGRRLAVNTLRNRCPGKPREWYERVAEGLNNGIGSRTDLSAIERFDLAMQAADKAAMPA
jgi:hypothetical protein